MGDLRLELIAYTHGLRKHMPVWMSLRIFGANDSSIDQISDM